jgi:hypothetical protein
MEIQYILNLQCQMSRAKFQRPISDSVLLIFVFVPIDVPFFLMFSREQVKEFSSKRSVCDLAESAVRPKFNPISPFPLSPSDHRPLFRTTTMFFNSDLLTKKRGTGAFGTVRRGSPSFSAS